MLIPFPAIPSMLGVPPIPRQIDVQPAPPMRLAIQPLDTSKKFVTWGIFDAQGKSIFNFDNSQPLDGVRVSVVSFEFGKDTKLSDFAVEGGGFATYNKVELSSTPSVTLAISGSEFERQLFLDTIDKAVKSTKGYSIFTPEIDYLNYALERYNYTRRADRGVTLLIVEIHLREVRDVAARFTQRVIGTPASPTAEPVIESGSKQAGANSTSALKAMLKKARGY